MIRGVKGDSVSVKLVGFRVVLGGKFFVGLSLKFVCL